MPARAATLSHSPSRAPALRTINVSGLGAFSITKVVTIDGTTQPGFTGAPLIELNGAGAGAAIIGININAQNVTVKGLIINRFTSVGINFDSFASNSVGGCYIGTNAAGTAASGNGAGRTLTTPAMISG